MQFQGEAPGVTEAHGIHDKSSPSRCMEGHGIPDVIPDESNLTRCMDPGDTRGPIGQTFQDQLEEIDAELARFDGGPDFGKEVRVDRGSNVVDQL